MPRFPRFPLLLVIVAACSSSSTNPASSGTGGSCGSSTCLATHVDTCSDTLNCGICGYICDPDNNDVPACEKGVCVAKCNDGSGKQCSSTPHAQATCDSATGCGQKCISGYRDCDGDCNNGCELQGAGCATAISCIN
jgi:hypothetical protein